MSDFPTQVTIKPPAAYASAPWLNFQGQDVSEVENQLKDVFPGIEYDSFTELVTKAYLEYGAVLTAVAGLAAPVPAQRTEVDPAPTQARAAAPAAPSGPPAPQCPHGEKVYREGNGAKGPWKAWFCPSPKGTPGQCKADFIR